ncbi:MFS transporter [Rhodococcus wratislaviensis]|uniref:Putative major facilitator superfamily transporter n=1 Tax=Rhodococcus wratislaviensis NBRC 100605 TaxID=1219028 RepID=X0R9I0_RHOWR|nr:MFS transporter [Rhodococcus wratislaviensis]GAF47655.1 putative major facilitator superfamily transporter [Rhodococcus wratislaviensis NBRC 100605]
MLENPLTSVVTGVRRPAFITAALAGCGLICSFMQTLVIPLVPELPQLLSTSSANASWIVTVTLLTGAVCTPISGRLGDIVGKKRVALVLLGAILLGSLLAAAATTLVPMIIGRAFQGAGLGVIPLGISILRDTIPAKKLGRAVALMSSTLGVGAAAGMPLSAVVSQHFDWHTLFWLSASLSVIGIAAIWIVVPASPQHRNARFDLLGAVGLAVGLSGLLLAVSKGADWGWTAAPTIGCSVGGLLVLVGWSVYQWRASNPLVDLRVSIRRQVLLTNLASVAVGFGLFTSPVVMPKLLEMPSTTGVGLGQSMLVTGLCMMPTGLIMMAMSPVAARVSDAYGPRACLILGIVTITAGYSLALLLMTQTWHTVLVGCFIGVGIGFAYAAMPTLIMQSVPESETAAANGLNTLMRSIGTSAASAVITVILAQDVVTVDGHDYTTTTGFRLAFATAGIASVVALIIAWAIPRPRRTDVDTGTPAEDRTSMSTT